MALISIEEPHGTGQTKHTFANHPLWGLGFRPFYLLAAIFAVISLPLWIVQYLHGLPILPNVGLFWHMHEMIFGLAAAVIVGFVFTGARNWTGLWTPRGMHLAALAGLWLAGRFAMLFIHPGIAAVIDIAFLPCAAWSIYRVLYRSGNKRNMFLVGLLGLLTVANIAFHGAVLGLITFNPITAMQAAILVVVTIESVIGGRVIPGFTSNGVPGTKPVVNPKRDRIAITLAVVTSIAWILSLPAPLVAALAIATGCAQLVRIAGWKPHRTIRNPLVWILQLSYAWIPIGFILLALSSLNFVSNSAAFHALTVGSMAGLMIGMMTRTALGHTGRQLKAGRSELVMYLLIQLAAIARVCAAIHPSASLRNGALTLAAISWTSAFLLYVVIYGPYLYRARIDGKEG